MKLPSPQTLKRSGQRLIARIPPAYHTLLWVLLAASVLLLLGYVTGYSLANRQADQARQQALSNQAEEHARELDRVQSARDALRLRLEVLSEQIESQVSTAEASTETLAALRADLAELRQRYAALDTRFDEQGAQLSQAEERVSSLESERQALREQLAATEAALEEAEARPRVTLWPHFIVPTD